MTEVPHLQTALTGPLLTLEKHMLDNQAAIEAWFRQTWLETPPPVTSSVDLRNAGFKLAPVDTNLFPAGFNNLSPQVYPLAIQAIQNVLGHQHPACKNILIIAESHTKQIQYYESLFRLTMLFKKAGYNIRVGSLLANLTDVKTITLPSGEALEIAPVQRDNETLCIDGFTPCLVILNHDLSGGVPELLQGIKQPLRPPIELSWAQRLKSKHFEHYQQITEDFAKLIDIDPWLINPLFRVCDEVDFVTREGEACIMHHADALLKSIQKKYDAYQIKQPPFLVIKADAGTYGMGVITVKNAEEIAQLNRKQRAKMTTLKGSQKLNRVIIQEGVYTFETCGADNAVAEPVVYMLGRHVVGGFYRVHTGRGADENLNAPGMGFVPLAFAENCHDPEKAVSPDESLNRFYAYGVIARLALAAAARELADLGVQPHAL